MRLQRSLLGIAVLSIVISGSLQQSANSEVSEIEYNSIKGLQDETLFAGDQVLIYLPRCFKSTAPNSPLMKAKLEIKNSGWKPTGKRIIATSQYCTKNAKYPYAIRFKLEALKVGSLELRLTYPGSTTHVSARVLPSVAALQKENEDQDRANFLSQNIERILSPLKEGKFTSAHIGIFLEKANSRSPIIARNESLAFEPASTLKVLVGLAIMKEVAEGTLKIDDSLIYFNYPNSTFNGGKDTCPIQSDEILKNSVVTSISEGYKMMMRNSDNRTTRAFVRLLGLKKLNDLASSLGMASTKFEQDFMGCGWRDGKRNLTTLEDLSRLYSAALTPDVLPNSNRAAEAFWNGMSNTYFEAEWPATTPQYELKEMIVSEASSLGLNGDELSLFLRDFRYRGKGGSYNLPCPSLSDSTGSCDSIRHQLLHRSEFISICVPVKFSSSTKSEITCDWYQGGWFTNDLIIPSSLDARRQESQAMSALHTALRPVIRKSLLSFKS
jgi:beta-lactamase class A